MNTGDLELHGGAEAIGDAEREHGAPDANKWSDYSDFYGVAGAQHNDGVGDEQHDRNIDDNDIPKNAGIDGAIKQHERPDVNVDHAVEIMSRFETRNSLADIVGYGLLVED